MTSSVILIIKHILALAIIVVIVMAPAWIARQTKKDKTQMLMIRISSWLFGWTGIGWLVGLYLATKNNPTVK